MEKWTWDEINMGRRMSKAEKRGRRLAVSMGASKRADGTIQPPKFAENPGYWITLWVMVIIIVLVAIFSRS
jgi:hypothetical protein